MVRVGEGDNCEWTGIVSSSRFVSVNMEERLNLLEKLITPWLFECIVELSIQNAGDYL